MDKSTAQTIVKVYAVLAWVAAFLSLIAGMIMLFIGSLFGSLGMMSNILEGMMFGTMMGAVGLFTGIVALILVAVYIIVGIGLWKFRSWARILAIILCALWLFSIPLGTIIGVFGIWFFGFSKDAKKLIK